MSLQSGYPTGTPYGQPPPSGQYTGVPTYASPGAPAYGIPGAPQAYGAPGAPQGQQPYVTPGAAQPTPYSASGIPQTTSYGAVGTPKQSPYNQPDVLQTSYGALPGSMPQVPGYGAPMGGNPYGTPAPPADPMWAGFSAVAGADQKIDAVELCKCLTQSGFTGSYKPFTQETCKIMIVLLDRNKTGKMDFPEYKELWVVLGKWKQTFESLDKDRSGSLDEQELKSAVASFGFTLSPTAIAAVMQRYNTNGKIYFDDFIALTTRIRSLSNYFMSRDTNRQGIATLGYDDFMSHAMSC
ncbi:Sorcin [Oopsacas minuta]|uniref:Sorcin n=1 Tax=Oopsacas minuta TaxID=111878 RepID=A0AAV7JWF7_9METZ|nr:Sorcin [Oopsacas minuta]